MFSLGVYLSQWRDSMMIIFMKPAKPDYLAPGAHQPIVLLNTFAKVPSACVAEDLVQMAEVHKLLPKTTSVAYLTGQQWTPPLCD